MKVLTANRLTDGVAVWYADGGWSETVDNADIAHDKAAEDRLEAIGAAAYANNEVVDVNLIDVQRRRWRRRAGPAAREDPRRRPHQPQRSRQAGCPVGVSTRQMKHGRTRPERPDMYRYDEFDHDFVQARVAEFSDQVQRRLAGEITEDQFRPLRLMNGVYLQLHAYMLRIAVPYGTLNGKQLRMLGHIARKYDKGYGHFTTRQNIQFNWPALSDIPAILADLASVEMHAIQTSGNCIRNVTADHFRRCCRRRGRRSAPLCRDPAAMVVGASGVLVPAAQIQDRGDGRRARPRRHPDA